MTAERQNLAHLIAPAVFLAPPVAYGPRLRLSNRQNNSRCMLVPRNLRSEQSGKSHRLGWVATRDRETTQGPAPYCGKHQSSVNGRLSPQLTGLAPDGSH